MTEHSSDLSVIEHHALAKRKYAQASIESMYRVFTVPEAPDSTLGRIDRNVSNNLAGFLQDHIVAVEHDLQAMEKDFAESSIPEKPIIRMHFRRSTWGQLSSCSVFPVARRSPDKRRTPAAHR